MRYTFLLSSALCLGSIGPGYALESDSLVQEASILKTAPLKEVTVFPNQARIQRSWTTSLKAGRQQVTLEGLEYGMASRTIQVLAGTSGVKVELVEVENAHFKDVLSTQAKDLRALIDREEKAIRKLSDELKAVRMNENLLQRIEIGRRPEGNPTEFQATPLDPDSWGTILDDIAAQEKRVRGELRGLERQLDERQVEMQVLLDRIRRLQAYEVMARKNLTLTVFADQAGDATFDIGYQVHGPGWFPHYQSRVDKDGGSIELTGYAVVFQGTGRDWTDVPVNVSTADPDAGSDIPELSAWYLREQINPHVARFKAGYAGRPMTKAEAEAYADMDDKSEGRALNALRMVSGAAQAGEAPRETMMMEEALRKDQLQQYNKKMDERVRRRAEHLARDGYFSRNSRSQEKSKNSKARYSNVESQISQNVRLYSQLRTQLEHLSARKVTPRTNRPHNYAGTRIMLPVSRGSWYDQEFRALTPGTIPSTSEPVRVLLGQHGFGSDFHYIVRPRESERAFLVSEAGNDSGKSWLPGGMRVFFDNDFVGKSQFHGLGEKGRLKLSLGVDENIKVKRTTKMLEKEAGVFSDDKKRTVEVTIEIRNEHDGDEEVWIEERLPVTNQKETEVKLSDDGSDQIDGLERDDSVKDRLRWKLRAKAGATHTFTWTYTISHDDSLKLQGFRP